MKLIVVFTVIATLSIMAPLTLATQQRAFQGAQNEQKVREKIKKRGTGPDAKVTVRLTSDVVYKGYVREANDTDFVLIDNSGGSHTVKYSEVRSVGGSGLSTAAKLGIGIGIGAGAVLLVLAAVVASDN